MNNDKLLILLIVFMFSFLCYIYVSNIYTVYTVHIHVCITFFCYAVAPVFTAGIWHLIETTIILQNTLKHNL